MPLAKPRISRWMRKAPRDPEPAKRWLVTSPRVREGRSQCLLTICKGQPGRVKAMALFRVTFHQLRHDSRDYGSDDRHIVSRVFFPFKKDGQALGDFFADLKQVVGSDLEEGEIEVGRPIGYDGPFNQERFSIAAREYFRSLISSKGAGISAMARRHIRMHNNLF
jgi:hypothetical protein